MSERLINNLANVVIFSSVVFLAWIILNSLGVEYRDVIEVIEYVESIYES